MAADWLGTALGLLGTLLFVTLNAVIFVLVYAKVMGRQFQRTAFKPARLKGEVVRLADVLGVDEARREAGEVVDFLRRSREYAAMGARTPRGILLVGPPGTGKTMLARAIAHEAGVPFFAVSGADFNEVFVGVGAGRLRALYAEARRHPAAIVFIDEIDAVGRQRASGPLASHEHNATLDALLVELDGFGREGLVVTVGATNVEEVLDAALLRPGRFDRKIHVGLPSRAGRHAILTHYMGRVRRAPGLEVEPLAAATAMMSGAELATLVNEAAIEAVRAGRQAVTAADCFAALERLAVGVASSRTLAREERLAVAYHEAGHAVLAHGTPHRRIGRVSILPSGRGLGHTWLLPVEERHLATRAALVMELATLLAGRCAEALCLGEEAVTSGAADDLRRATALAESMVWDLGFAPGYPGAYRDRMLAGLTREGLDLAVGALLEEATALARAALSDARSALECLAAALLVHEVLDGPAVLRLLDAGGHRGEAA